MKKEAVEADALYVLGDLFEFWIGDDDKSEFATSIRQAFIDLVKTGVPCYFTQGNRDFLVGKKFAKQTGVKLLDEVSTIDNKIPKEEVVKDIVKDILSLNKDLVINNLYLKTFLRIGVSKDQ